MYVHYRETRIGRALQNSIQDCINQQEIKEDSKELILSIFDQTIPTIFNRTVTTTLSFKGFVDSYNFLEGVWTFTVKNFLLTTNNKLIKADFVRIVACDGSGKDDSRKRKSRKELSEKSVVQGKRKKKKRVDE